MIRVLRNRLSPFWYAIIWMMALMPLMAFAGGEDDTALPTKTEADVKAEPEPKTETPQPGFTLNFLDSSEDTQTQLQHAIEEALKAEREAMAGSGIILKPEKLALTERETITRVLKSESYYRPKVNYDLTDGTIRYEVEPRQRYKIRLLRYEIPDSVRKPELKEVKLKNGDFLRAEDVLAALSKLKSEVEKANCLYEVDASYDAKVFHETAEAELVFTVKESPQALFGTVNIKGTTSVREDYIANRMAFKEDTCFKRSLIDKSRLHLLQTGMFATVDTTLETAPDGEHVNLHVQVSERKHRTITAGGGFSSDQGVGVTAGWEHRNFYGGAEKLQIDSKISQEYTGLEGRITLPDFLRQEQALELGAELVQESPDAYDSTRMEFSGKISRKLTSKVKAYVGAEFKLSEITDLNGDETFALFSFPSGLEMDKRDSTLDPKKGFITSIEVQPFFNALDTNINFIKTTVAGSTYFTFEKAFWKPTLALRGAFGTMQGVDTDSIPADERYYSGGSGSVRGYGYQLLGPLNGTEPVGGRSLLEFSAETRLRFSQDWGGVVFLDGGNAYDDYIPAYDDGMLWAAGIGARYYTSFAPIRFDIAIPLDRRNNVDDAFQFYISIGQAF